MSRNVFRFRRLKWGDPKKFKMLPGEPTPPRGKDAPGRAKPGQGVWIDRMLIAAIVIALAFSAVLLLG